MVVSVLKSWTETANREETKPSQEATTKNSIVPILFLCNEESLVSSNLNSKQLRFHGAQPSLYGLAFLSRNYRSFLDHDLMASIWEKSISILAGNLNSGRSYFSCTYPFLKGPNFYSRRNNLKVHHHMFSRKNKF